MIRRSTLIAVEILLGLVAALVIGVAVAWWRLSQGPVELNFIRQTVQAELSAARSGRPVGIDRVVLAWSREGALELRAINVRVEDGRGNVLSRSNEARIELGVLPLLIGRVQVESAEFIGGEITLTRKLDDAMQIAFGPEGSPPDIIIPASQRNETLEQKVARLLDGMEAAFRPVGPGGGLRAIRVRNARLAIIDEKGGGRWTADAAQFQLARQGRDLALNANARLEGANGLAPATLRITTDTRFQSAIIEFGAQNVRPRALFSQAALGPFGGLDAPLTATVSIGLDRRTGINRFEGEAVLGRGAADMAGGRFDLRGGRIHGRYDIDSDELIIDELQLGGARTRVGGEAHVRHFSSILRAAPNQPAAFDISLPSLSLDVPGTFQEPLAFSNVQATGAIVSAERTIRLTRFHAETGQAALNAAGRFYWGQAGADRALHPGVELTGNIDGALDVRTVTHVWPMGLGEGARAYLARTLEAGRITDAVVRLDIRPADTAAGVLRNEAVDVRFNVAGGQMRFISTMSPVTAASGSAVLRGNSFELTVPEARINDLAVTSGRIDIPRFKPGGEFLTISAHAEGEARRVLEILMQQPINLRDKLPVDAVGAAGRAAVNLRLQRPLHHDAPWEEWRFNVDGTIRDFAGNMTTRRVTLSQGQLNVRGDQRVIVVSGPIRAGASAIQNARWTQRIGPLPANVSSSEYQISGDFAARDLERLGYSIAQYAEGRVGVTVTGQGRGFDVDNARIEVDLANAAVDSPWSFWTKRAGQPATARFNVERLRDGGLAFNNLEVRGAGLNLQQGRVRLARDNRIMEVDLPRLALEGRSDAHLSATRASDGGLDVAVRGALFDAAPFMANTGDAEEPAANAQPTAAPARPAPEPVRANVAVDRLKMRGGATLSDARVDLIVLRNALSTLVAEGQSPGGRAFSLAMGPRQTDPQGHIRFRSDDAGFAARALTGAENVVGGSASADGDWRGGPPSQGRFTVRLRNFQVVRLPAMARLLSSAGSLTGLVEMLNGDGIGFSSLDAQMAYANNRITFTEGAMRGPSLGLTGSGSYDIRRDNLDIDGVVAPSPTLNLSMLGEVPVLGDLLVSRRGEGVFGMTYSINGRAGEPRVGVNPVSALTPGILRRIFEPAQPRNGGGAHSLPAGENHAAAPTGAVQQETANAAPAP
jgi:uncharacterized protein YhdP